MKEDTASSLGGSVCPFSVHSILPLSATLKQFLCACRSSRSCASSPSMLLLVVSLGCYCWCWCGCCCCSCCCGCRYRVNLVKLATVIETHVYANDHRRAVVVATCGRACCRGFRNSKVTSALALHEAAYILSRLLDCHINIFFVCYNHICSGWPVSKMPFTSLVVNTQLTLEQKKELAVAVTQIFVDALKVRASVTVPCSVERVQFEC